MNGCLLFYSASNKFESRDTFTLGMFGRSLQNVTLSQTGRKNIKQLNDFRFDTALRDFIIAKKPLLDRLEKHENVNPQMYQPALCVDHNAIRRLLGLEPPDLIDNHVAIYVCGHCGDYDGIAIGAIISIQEEFVSWKDLGWQDEVDETWRCFSKVTDFSFDLGKYSDVLLRLTD